MKKVVFKLLICIVYNIGNSQEKQIELNINSEYFKNNLEQAYCSKLKCPENSEDIGFALITFHYDKNNQVDSFTVDDYNNEIFLRDVIRASGLVLNEMDRTQFKQHIEKSKVYFYYSCDSNSTNSSIKLELNINKLIIDKNYSTALKIINDEIGKDPYNETVHLMKQKVLMKLEDSNAVQKTNQIIDLIRKQVFTCIKPCTGPSRPKNEEMSLYLEGTEPPRFKSSKCEELLTIVERKRCADSKMLSYLYSNIKYPESAKKEGIQGRVVISFIIEKDGAISDVVIVRDIGGGCGLEAMRVVNKMNNEQTWIPAKLNGEITRVQFNLPIQFKIN